MKSSNHCLPGGFFLMIAVLFSLSSGADFRRGTTELGGMGSLSSISENDFHYTQLQLAPALLFYPADVAFVGPVFDFLGKWAAGSSITDLGLGIQGGMLFTNSGRAIPYMGMGFAYLSRNSRQYSINGASVSLTGFLARAFVGLKVQIGGAFFLNIQPTYEYRKLEQDKTSAIGINLGVSGIF